MAKRLPFVTGKKGPQFQIDIFCHLKFCHNRRNGFQLLHSLLTLKSSFSSPPSFKCVFTTGCPNRPFIFALYLIGPHANNYLYVLGPPERMGTWELISTTFGRLCEKKPSNSQRFSNLLKLAKRWVIGNNYKVIQKKISNLAKLVFWSILSFKN